MNFLLRRKQLLAHMGVPCSFSQYHSGERCFACESREDELDKLLIEFAVEAGAHDPEASLRSMKRSPQ